MYEPPDRLIDKLVQMYENDRLQYVRLKTCAFEVRHALTKEDKSLAVDSSGMVKMKIQEPHLEADISADLLVRQAFARRGLGMEQANLVGFANHEAWQSG